MPYIGDGSSRSLVLFHLVPTARSDMLADSSNKTVVVTASEGKRDLICLNILLIEGIQRRYRSELRPERRHGPNPRNPVAVGRV